MLSVIYDDCVSKNNEDGLNESWYFNISEETNCYHLGHEETTIKYYFEEETEEESVEDNSLETRTYKWTDLVSADEEKEIKEAYANSMKKWNNVYFYFYNDDGSVTKNKIINVVEGTKDDHNLSIYPSSYDTYLASTQAVGGKEDVEEKMVGDNIVDHNHYNQWKMKIYVCYFSFEGEYSNEYVNAVRERTGAHELGHVLGLFDADNECTIINDHHEEILMGYGSPITSRSQDITYKDIAGVAITRGFHTDNDHKWLYCGQNNYGKHRLLCSICNGFKEVDSLNGYIYDVYGYCNGSHTLSSGHMMAVASYGTKDYYKCKYCRYVAPFSSIVDQEYSKTNYSHTHHKCVNNVSGLLYTFYEQHNIVNNWCSDCNEYIHSYDNNYESSSTTQHKAYCECGEYVFQNHVIQNNECIACGEPHTHDYSDHFVHEDSTTHKSYCICGGYIISGHVVSNEEYISGKRYATCLACGGMASLGMIHHQGIGALPRTENGSFILPDGIIVLVDEDIEAYLVGTLEFIYPDGNLETE